MNGRASASRLHCLQPHAGQTSAFISGGSSSGAGGFSLIEVAAVLVVLGLLAGAASLSLRSVGRNFDFEQWVERATGLDRQARERAQRDGLPRRVVIDLDGQTMLEEPIASNRDAEVETPMNLEPPRGWACSDAWRIDGEDTDWRLPEIRGSSGGLSIHVSSDGFGASYAIALRDEAERRRWLVVAGGSGQATIFNDERLLRETLQTLASAGDDID